MSGSYLAELAPRGIKDDQPWLLSLLEFQQILNARPAEIEDGVCLKDIWYSTNTIRCYDSIATSLFLEVSLVESTLLGLGIFPPPPTFTFMLTRQDWSCAGLTTDRDVPLDSKQ